MISPVSDFSFSQAVFLAALPYRRSTYAGDGLRQSHSSGAWRAFLRDRFTPNDLRAARKTVESHLRRPIALKDGSWGWTTYWDECYPDLLRNIFDPPLVLFYYFPAGNWRNSFDAVREIQACWPTPDRTGIAIVGTRRMHALVPHAVRLFVGGLRYTETTIVSGFARGVDRHAHIAAIENRLPGIAVLGAGLTHCGPSSNFDIVSLAPRQSVPFCFLSEFPPLARAAAGNFPRRNRIIAGLSRAVVVMQAPARSGAMITARYAAEEGRDVLAFDHPVLELWPGVNDGARSLLEQGAEPVVVPELTARLVQERPLSRDRAARARQLLSSGVHQGAWLGGSYYLAG